MGLRDKYWGERIEMGMSLGLRDDCAGLVREDWDL